MVNLTSQECVTNFVQKCSEMFTFHLSVTAGYVQTRQLFTQALGDMPTPRAGYVHRRLRKNDDHVLVPGVWSARNGAILCFGGRVCLVGKKRKYFNKKKVTHAREALAICI